MVGVGVAVGPITGGWLLEHFSWGSIFLVNVPVAAVAIVGGILFVPTSRDPATPPSMSRALMLSAIGVTALVYTVIEAPNWGWSSARTAVGFGVAAVVLAGFALWERRTCASDARCVGVRQPAVLRWQLGGDRGLSYFVRFHLRHHPVLPIHQGLQRIRDRCAVAAGRRLDRARQHPRTTNSRTGRHHGSCRRGSGRSSRPGWDGRPPWTRAHLTPRSPCRCCSSAAG